MPRQNLAKRQTYYVIGIKKRGINGLSFLKSDLNQYHGYGSTLHCRGRSILIHPSIHPFISWFNNFFFWFIDFRFIPQKLLWMTDEWWIESWVSLLGCLWYKHRFWQSVINLDRRCDRKGTKDKKSRDTCRVPPVTIPTKILYFSRTIP